MGRTLNLTAVSVILTLSMVSCAFHQGTYYVDSCDMTISIDQIDYDLYRVYLDTGHDISCRNYIDVTYHMSEMPSVTFYFPFKGSDTNTTYTVYVADRDNEVTQYKSKDFNIEIPKFYQKYPGASSPEWTDSTMFRTPCIQVVLNAYLDGIDVWGADGGNTELPNWNDSDSVPPVFIEYEDGSIVVLDQDK